MTPAAFDPLADGAAAGWHGDPRRGASMGRESSLPESYRRVVIVSRVAVDDGGYDDGGAYWGIRMPGRALWMAHDPEYVDGVAFIDARDDWESAAEAARDRFPRAIIRRAGATRY